MPTTTRPPRCPTHRGRQTGCPTCNRREAWARRDRQGQTRRVPPAAAQQHIKQLQAAGATLDTIAAEAGVSDRQLTEILTGIPRYIHIDTEAAILGVTTPPLGQWRDATGTARMLRALNRIGWPFVALADRLGVTQQAVSQWARMTVPRVHRNTAERVAELYRELAGIPGPSVKAAAHAAAKGWHSPAAWNNIDDPAEQPDTEPAPEDTQPDEVAVQRALTGQARYQQLHRADRIAAYRQLAAAGHGRTAIQNRLHINATTLRQLAALAEEVAA